MPTDMMGKAKMPVGNTPMPTSRRAFMALAGLLPLAVASCSSATNEPVATPVSSHGFPKIVDHRFGFTRLESPPSRVVALGTVEAETLVALGISPLSRPGIDTTAWYRAGLRALGPTAPPQHHDDGRQLTPSVFEELHPDAFVSVGDRLSIEEYKALSKIAPVVIAPDEVRVESWESTARFVGEITGLGERAEALIAEAKQEILAVASNYPGLDGATALFVSASSVSGSDLVLSVAGSTPMDFFASVGLTTPAVVGQLQQTLKRTPPRFPQGTVYLPRERAGDLTADAMVVSIPMSDFSAYKANKRLSPDFPSFGAGTVYVVAGDERVALQDQSITSAKWAARNIVPELAKSVYKSI